MADRQLTHPLPFYSYPWVSAAAAVACFVENSGDKQLKAGAGRENHWGEGEIVAKFIFLFLDTPPKVRVPFFLPIIVIALELFGSSLAP